MDKIIIQSLINMVWGCGLCLKGLVVVGSVLLSIRVVRHRVILDKCFSSCTFNTLGSHITDDAG